MRWRYSTATSSVSRQDAESGGTIKSQGSLKSLFAIDDHVHGFGFLTVSAGLKGIHFRRFALSHLCERLPWGAPTR
jgi:hypothetical protein